MRRLRFEEEPEPEEPDAPEAPPAAAAPAATVPSVEGGENREFEYRTEVLTSAKLTDGKTLARTLTEGSKDGWDLVKLMAVGDQHVVLLRKAKSSTRSDRRVGFAITRG